MRLGANRSTKRDRILDVFLQQDGHVSADELYAAVRRQHPQIGRATVYRALQRMVEAGLAHKMDFGDGRARYDASPGRPRHFHLVCTTCRSSSEFLSPDIEAGLEGIAATRGFTQAHVVVQVHGLCARCREGRTTPTIDGPAMRWVFERDALRVAIETGRAAADFYLRAAEGGSAVAALFAELATNERRAVHALEARSTTLRADHPEIDTWPPFLFVSDSASLRFIEAVRHVDAPADPLRVAIDCERASYRFYEEHATRFEESEGRAVFASRAAAGRQHLARLIRAQRQATRRR
jgi:Fur family transcriptional regulator, ferric uptake regulator